jgi:hypothetical protein
MSNVVAGPDGDERTHSSAKAPGTGDDQRKSTPHRRLLPEDSDTGTAEERGTINRRSFDRGAKAVLMQKPRILCVS